MSRLERTQLISRRLALLDLAAGHSQLADERRRFWSVFNGEIYNHAELRRELTARGHDIRGHGDSELIPHLYEQWGDSFVERLRGMFALAVYDRNAGAAVPRTRPIRDQAAVRAAHAPARAVRVRGAHCDGGHRAAGTRPGVTLALPQLRLRA